MLKKQNIKFDLRLTFYIYVLYLFIEGLLFIKYSQDDLFLSIIGNADFSFEGIFRYYLINAFFVASYILGTFTVKFNDFKDPIRYEWVTFLLTAVGSFAYIIESIYDYTPPFGVITLINLAPLCVYYGVRRNHMNSLFVILILLSVCALFGMRTIFIFSILFLIYLKGIEFKKLAYTILTLFSLLIYTQYLRLRYTYDLDSFDFHSVILSFNSFVYFYIVKGFYNGVAICSVEPGYSFNSTTQILPRILGLAPGGADVDLGSHGTMNFAALLWTDFGWISVIAVCLIGWYLGKSTLNRNGGFNEFIIFYTASGVLLSTRINFFMLNIFIIPFLYLFFLRSLISFFKLASKSINSHRG